MGSKSGLEATRKVILLTGGVVCILYVYLAYRFIQLGKAFSASPSAVTSTDDSYSQPHNENSWKDFQKTDYEQMFWPKHFGKKKVIEWLRFSECLSIEHKGNPYVDLTHLDIQMLKPAMDDDGDNSITEDELHLFVQKYGTDKQMTLYGISEALKAALSELHRLGKEAQAQEENVVHGEQGGGCALQLSRADKEYVEVSSSGDLQFGGTAPFTMEAWIKPLSDTKDMTILSKYNRGKWGQYFIKVTPSGNVFFHREVAPWGQKSSARLPRDEFSHIAVTYGSMDSSKPMAKIYINGTLVASQKEGGQDNNPETFVLFGAMQERGQPVEFFDGVLDEIRIWEVERSAEQIQHTMHVILTGSEHGLVGYWNFDECAGARLKDKLGRHDGVRRGGKYVQSSVQLRTYQSTFGCVDTLC